MCIRAACACASVSLASSRACPPGVLCASLGRLRVLITERPRGNVPRPAGLVHGAAPAAGPWPLSLVHLPRPLELSVVLFPYLGRVLLPDVAGTRR